MAANQYPVFPQTVKAKNISLIVSKLLSPDDVCLGRLITNIWDPSAKFLDPDFEAEFIADSTSSRAVQRVESISNTTRTRRLGNIITKLLSTTSLTTTNNSCKIQATNVEHFKLRNPDRCFDIAIKQGGVQSWLTESFKSGLTAFMITGYSIVRDLDLSATSDSNRTQSTTISATAPINVALDHMGLCLSGPLRSTLDQHHVGEKKAGAFCSGDNVWAILYRKVKLQVNPATSTLSPSSKSWTIISRIRAQDETELVFEPELETDSDAEVKSSVIEAVEDDETKWELFGEGEEDVFLFPCVDEEEEDDNDDEEEEEED